MKNTSPIGIFDSGIGGITIWQEIVNQLPYENTLYLADNKNAPYGIKTADEVLNYSIKNTEYLISKGVKLIVIACNTATTNSISKLRSKFPNIKFIGVEPAIKPAALNSKSKRIAVLATSSTLQSVEFHEALKKQYMKNVELTKIAGAGLVQLIEKNKIDSPEMRDLLRLYTHEMKQAKIDQLVLGCTHYPYLKEQLQKLLPDKVKIIDSGEAVARQTKYILESENKLNDQNQIGTHSFYYNKPNGNIQYFVPNDQNCKLEYIDF